LQKAIEKLFFEVKYYDKILKLNPRRIEKYKNDTFSPDFIKNIMFDGYCTEISPINKRLHAHIMLTVKHITNVHCNHTFIQEYFKNVLENPGVYVHIKTVAGGPKNLKEYIGKDEDIELTIHKKQKKDK
jgi:hypothetical protein